MTMRGSAESLKKGLALAAAVLLAAACADEPTVPMDAGTDVRGDAPAFAMHLACTVDVRAGNMACDPSSPSGGNGPSMNLIVGSQHRYVRLASAEPFIMGDTWYANVTVQNLTLQPFATLNGKTARPAGVRVFFVDEPDNGVVVSHHDGTAAFLESGTQKYYEYDAELLGDDGILTPGEESVSKLWQFALNGATEFRFSVLVWTEVPDPSAYSVHLTRVSVGDDHTCGEGADGKVYCWGNNLFGQLGVDDDGFYSTPVAVATGLSFTNVSAGGSHTCADDGDGTVYCWGDNTFGQLGTGMGDGVSAVPTAVAEPDVDEGDVSLSRPSAGTHHTCAEGSDGNVWCWGSNTFGQLGDGDNFTSEVPVAVAKPDGVATLRNPAAGENFTCAEGSDGNVWCWGANFFGQLGNDTIMDSTVPVMVGIEGVSLSRPTVGLFHACAQGDDDQVYCWGDNTSGQLGDGTTTGRATPQPVKAGASLKLSNPGAGAIHTCAEGSDGNVWCWGANNGLLGDGTEDQRLTPARVQAPAGVRLSRLDVGYGHACAIGSNGPSYCWGFNAGQLGSATTAVHLTPVVVAGTRAP